MYQYFLGRLKDIEVFPPIVRKSNVILYRPKPKKKKRIVRKKIKRPIILKGTVELFWLFVLKDADMVRLWATGGEGKMDSLTAEVRGSPKLSENELQIRRRRWRVVVWIWIRRVVVWIRGRVSVVWNAEGMEGITISILSQVALHQV